MARVRGSSRLAPPPRVVKDADADADAIIPSADMAMDELRVARQPHRTTAAFTNPFTQPHSWTENWREGRQLPGGNNGNNIFSNDNTQAMDWSRDDAEERWKQARKIHEELRAPKAATLALMDGRFSDDELPEARYEELEKRRSNYEIQFMDWKGALARPQLNKVNTSLDADFRTALGTPVFPANDSDSEDDNSPPILYLDDQHIERLNANVAVQEAKRGIVRRNTNELYDATKSATQSFVYQQRAVRRREDLHEFLSAGKDDATESHKLQKTYMWPMLAGPIKKDEDELAFEALVAQIAVTVEDYKTYVPAVEEDDGSC